MRYRYHDGGRSEHFKGLTGDCVVRAVAIAAELPYREVYDELYRRGLEWAERSLATKRADRIIAEHPEYEIAVIRKAVRARATPRKGVAPSIFKPYIASLGFEWTPTMFIGSGCRVHLRDGELPDGRLIVRCSKHVVAVNDGVIRDTGDPSRGGTRCVYGYWKRVG